MGVQNDAPIDNQSVWTHPALKSALDLNIFFVSGNPYRLGISFSFDAGSGTIDISPNKFQTGDDVNVSFNKLITQAE